jgi:hypothetical protein
MVDTSPVDILALIERKAGIRTVGKPVRVHGVLEIHSNCPWCPGTLDSFIIRPEEGTYSHAIRQGTGSGCGRHGDAISFLYEWEGTSFLDACEELGISLDESVPAPTSDRKRHKPEYPPQRKKWRDTADAKLSRAQAMIHTGVGLEYARGRGLTDGTILDWRLGYVPFRDDMQHFFTLDADEWGIDHDKKYYMYEGLLIPWFVKGKVWKLQVRRISGQIDPRFKILPIKGSVEHCLFNQDEIHPDKPVVLVESALCAISGNQEAGNIATFVATGGTKANQYEHNVSLLACAPVVLVAFDDDQNGAGESGAKYWLNALPHAFRWLPWAKDINAMLVEGMDIKVWVEVGLLSAALEDEQQEEPSAPPSQMGRADDEQDEGEDPRSAEEIEQEAMRYRVACGILSELETRGLALRFSPTSYEFVGLPPEVFSREIYDQRIAQCEVELRDILDAPLASNPLDDPVIQSVMGVFHAEVIEILPQSDWP